MGAYEVLLHEIELRVDPGESELAVVGGASLHRVGDELPDDLTTLPGFELGAGTVAPVPDEIVARFGDVFEPPAASPGLWIASNAVLDGSDVPAWYAVFNADGVDAWGLGSLPAGSVTVPGLVELGEISVRLALRVRGAAVVAARFELTGSARCSADLAGIGLTAATTADPDGSIDGEGSFRLAIEVDDLAAIDALIDDPGRILDSPFRGELHLALGYSGLAFPGGRLPATAVTIDADAGSDGDGELVLDHLRYEQVSDGDLVVGALEISDLRLRATLDGWSSDDTAEIELAGSAGVTLPAFLDDSSPRTAFESSVRFRRDDDGVRFELGAERIVLDPAVNVLELTGAQLALVAVLGDDDWQLAVRGRAVQSWQRLAARLRSAGLMLADAPGFPHLLGEVELVVADDGAGGPDVAFSLDLTLVDPATGDGEVHPYEGPLGFLPVDVSDVRLHLSATVDDGELVGWQVSGSGTASSGPALGDAIHFRDVAVTASVGMSSADDPGDLVDAPGDGDVELTLRITDLPPLSMPALDPSAGTIEVLEVTELTVWLSDRLEVTAGVILLAGLDGDGLADALGVPGWDELFTPLGSALGGVRGWLRLLVPFDDQPLRAEIELRPGTRTVFDLAQLAVDVATEIGTALDVTVPADGRSVGDSVALVEPEALRFVAELGDSMSMSLSARSLLTILGETFDAVLTVAVVNGAPELSLLAGVDDPIHIALSASALIDVAASVDIPAMIGDAQFGVATEKRAAVAAALADMHLALIDFFSAPGMEFDLGFEIRNLGVTFRPTDGDRMLRAGGAVRLTQMPGWLEDVLPGGGPSAVLSTSVSSIRIELQMPTAEEGATRVEPLVEYDFAQWIDDPALGPQVFRLVLRSLMLEYSWASNAVRVGWDVGADLPLFNMVEQFGSGIALPDVTGTPFEQLASSGKLGVTATNPPIPTVEWSFTSGDPDDTSQRGVELVAGIPGQRFVTLFARQFSLFPTYQMGQPAIVLDGGMVIGNPPSSSDPRSDELYLVADVQGGVIQVTPAPLGLLINPLALVPPYLTPQPPYWVYPPHYMADLYADAIVFRCNVPGVVSIDAVLERPVPSLSLPAMLELGLLAVSGFDVARIPADSEIRTICYVSLDVTARLPLAELLGGNDVPELDLHLEVNAADLLELAMRLAGGVRDTLDTGADLVATLVDEPDQLVRAIPAAARRFEGALGIGGVHLSGSLHLLTSDELLEETVLFHESTRRRRRGVAALDDPCGRQLPHHDPPVVTTPITAIAVATSWTSRLDPRRATPTVPQWQQAHEQSARSLRAATERRTRDLASLGSVHRKLTEMMVRRLVDHLKQAKDLDEYVEVMRKHSSVGDAALGAVIDVVARSVDEVGPRPAGGAALGGWVRKLVGSLTKRLADAPAFALGHGPGPFELATRFAETVFRARRTREPTWKVEVLSFRSWPEAYRKVVGAELDGRSRLHEQLARIAKDLSARVGRHRELPRGDYEALFKQLVVDLARVFEGLRRGELLSATELAERLGTGMLERRFRDRWTWDDRTVERSHAIVAYDGTLTAGAAAVGLGAAAGLALDRGGNERVDVPVGWHVVVSDRLDPPLDAELSPPLHVPSPRADVTVRFRGGVHELVVRDRGGETVRTVPDEVLEHPEAGPPGPRRLERLRAMFHVAERREVRLVERAADEVCTAPHLYQDSLFARPEYLIDPSGGLQGVHGPLSLGDLLRDPETGDYVVAPGPVVVAGVTAELPVPGAAEIRMCGLVAPELTSGGTPGVTTSCFLDGYGNVEIPLPAGYVARLEGSFTLIQGDLWPPRPGVPAGDSLRVEGSIELEHDGHTVLTGAALGRLVSHDDRVDLDLSIEIELDFDVELEIGGVDLARVWTCGGGGSAGPVTVGLHLVRTGDQLEITADAAVQLCFATAEIELEQVEIAPAATICAWVPKLDANGVPVLEQVSTLPPVFLPVMVEECVTTPPVTVPVPRLGELGPAESVSASLAILAQPGGIDVTGSFASPGIGSVTFDLDDLLPGIEL